jgi:hypothetical protein
MLVYRTNTELEKITSPSFRSSDGCSHKLEILGHGQQFVAYGDHPDIERPYYWMDDSYSELVNVQPEELGLVTEQQLLNVVSIFEQEIIEIAEKYTFTIPPVLLLCITQKWGNSAL